MSHPELASALRGVLAHIREHPDFMTRNEMNWFHELAMRVCVEAVKTGLGERLPKVPELAPALAHPGMPELPPVQYESRLYLPGDWTDAHVDSDDLLPIPRWQDGDP